MRFASTMRQNATAAGALSRTPLLGRGEDQGTGGRERGEDKGNGGQTQGGSGRGGKLEQGRRLAKTGPGLYNYRTVFTDSGTVIIGRICWNT